MLSRTTSEEAQVSDQPWLASVPEDDLGIYELAGFGGPSGFGDNPALLLIDLQYRTAGDSSLPIRESIQTMYPMSCGDRAWAAIPHISAPPSRRTRR